MSPTIRFLNYDGGGYVDEVFVDEGTTIEQFREKRVPGRSGDFVIRVNRDSVRADYELQEGDRVTITPSKVAGAVSTFLIRVR